MFKICDFKYRLFWGLKKIDCLGTIENKKKESPMEGPVFTQTIKNSLIMGPLINYHDEACLKVGHGPLYEFDR